MDGRTDGARDEAGLTDQLVHGHFVLSDDLPATQQQQSHRYVTATGN